MVDRTDEAQAAHFGRMAQHNTTISGVAGFWMQRPTWKHPCLPGVIASDGGGRWVRRHLRRDDHRPLPR